MGLLRFPHRRSPEEPPPAEHSVVRQYRDVLVTASPDALLRLHRDALPRLDPFVRVVVRNTAAAVVTVGHDVSPDDPAHLAALVIRAAGPDPTMFLDALPDGVRHRLAQAVTATPRPADRSAPSPTLSQMNEPRQTGTLLP